MFYDIIVIMVTVGIPRALLFHYYGDKWVEFFNQLGVKTVTSPPTNREIVKRGIALSVDEACFSSKLYLGHVDWLVGKCDMLFSLRMENVGIREDFCPRIFGMQDVTRHTFPNLKLLHADVNYIMRKREVDAFIQIGAQLGFDAEKSKQAFLAADVFANKKRQAEIAEQEQKLNNPGLRVLLVSHAYNIADAYIGRDIVEYFKKQNITTIFAHQKNKTKPENKRLYWTINAEIMGGVEMYQNRVDGIVLVTTFPCGPDSIFNEMLIRSTTKPVLSLMVDELDASAGLQTRLESFVDILTAREVKK